MYHLTRTIPVALVALAIALAGRVDAQDDADWSAYVYSQAQQTLVRVNTQGEQVSYDLELGPSVALQGRHMTFWPDGDRAAYCAVRYGAANEATLYVRDLPAAENLVAIAFPNAADCRVTQSSLDADSNRIAVALFNYFPGAADADATVPSWEIALADTERGVILAQLSGDIVAATTDIAPDTAIIAETAGLLDDAVLFFAIPYAVGASTTYPIYAWNLSDGSVVPVEGQRTYSVSTLPAAAERAYATQDESLPFATPNGPIPANNIVLYSRDDEPPYPIFHTANWLVISATFIENGQRLAISLVPGADEPQTSAFSVAVRTIALDRQGQTADLLTTDGNAQLLPAPGGFIALVGPRDPTGPYRLQYSTGGQLRTLWSASGEAWELVWAAPVPTAPELPPFPAWSP